MTVKTESLPDIKIIKGEVVETIVKSLGRQKLQIYRFRGDCYIPPV